VDKRTSDSDSEILISSASLVIAHPDYPKMISLVIGSKSAYGIHFESSQGGEGVITPPNLNTSG